MTWLMLIPLSRIRVITKSLMSAILIWDSPGPSPCLATFEILAAFKDGQLFKGGHCKSVNLINCGLTTLPIMGLFIGGSLDYTSHTFRWLIWGENAHRVFIMAILWLKRLSRQSINFHISLITLHLQDIMLFEEHWSRFGDLCLSSDKAGNR